MFAKKGGGNETVEFGSVEIETREDSIQVEQEQNSKRIQEQESSEQIENTGDTQMVDELTVDEGMQVETDARKEEMVYRNKSISPGFTQPKPDYGMFTGARISGDEDGNAMVVVPMRRGRLILELDAELAAADILDNFAGSILAESKKHKP